MQNHKWNPIKAAAIGVVVSPLGLMAQMLMGNTAVPNPADNAGYYVGLIVGGMIGGALLFGLVAVLRNALVR